jgi:hypothetical protein
MLCRRLVHVPFNPTSRSAISTGKNRNEVIPVNARAITSSQLRLDFEPGILEQFPTIRECVLVVVLSSKVGISGCAVACDVSPSTLSKMLNEQENPDNKRNLPAAFIPIICKVTGDSRPLQWLIASASTDEATRKQRALATVEELLPALLDAVQTIKGAKKK